MFNKQRSYLGLVKLDRAVRRPSGILFDEDGAEAALYVLNLWGNSVMKFVLQK